MADTIEALLPALIFIALFLWLFSARSKRELGNSTIKAVMQEHGWEEFTEPVETILGEAVRTGTRGLYRGRRVSFFEAVEETVGPMTFEEGAGAPATRKSVWWELRVSTDHPTPMSTFSRSGLEIQSCRAVVPIKQELADWWGNHPSEIKKFTLDHGELMVKFRQGPSEDQVRETMDFLVDAAERL